jgi:hypothetical protein
MSGPGDRPGSTIARVSKLEWLKPDEIAGRADLEVLPHRAMLEEAIDRLGLPE